MSIFKIASKPKAKWERAGDGGYTWMKQIKEKEEQQDDDELKQKACVKNDNGMQIGLHQLFSEIPPCTIHSTSFNVQ